MKRAALDRNLMLRRLHLDLSKHGDQPCDCTPGRFRKRRPYGCPKGRGCVCKIAWKADLLDRRRWAARLHMREQSGRTQGMEEG